MTKNFQAIGKLQEFAIFVIAMENIFKNFYVIFVLGMRASKPGIN